MNANKLTLYSLLVSVISFSKTKNDGIFCMLNYNHKDYVLKTNKVQVVKNKNIDVFKFYDRIKYEERQEKIKKKVNL